MSTKPEIYKQLKEDIQENGTLYFSRNGRARAQAKLLQARVAYYNARREVLRYDAAFFRASLFASASISENDPEFGFMRDLSYALAFRLGIDISTGGGPSLMLAGNLGVTLARQEAERLDVKFWAKSHGILLTSLSGEQGQNQHLDMKSDHPEFTTRLQEFVDKNDAFYVGPGGKGSLLEMALIEQLLQVGHLRRTVVPLIAHPFWKPLIEKENEVMYYNRNNQGKTPLIRKDDLTIMRFSDNIDEIVGIIGEARDNKVEKYIRHIKWVR